MILGYILHFSQRLPHLVIVAGRRWVSRGWDRVFHFWFHSQFHTHTHLTADIAHLESFKYSSKCSFHIFYHNCCVPCVRYKTNTSHRIFRTQFFSGLKQKHTVKKCYLFIRVFCTVNREFQNEFEEEKNPRCVSYYCTVLQLNFDNFHAFTLLSQTPNQFSLRSFL